MLVQKGANIHAKDPNGYSLLHLAAEKGEIEVVKDLLARGADINA
jgi:ankyrin repeat protein